MTREIFICLGYGHVAGCGRVLTAEEKHYYGACCESCMRVWHADIVAWREGGENKELDEMFSGQEKKQ